MWTSSCEALPTPTDRTSQSLSISPASIESCRQALLTSFRLCNNDEFQRLSCVISCTLNSVRPLKISELEDAVATSLGLQPHQSSLSTLKMRDFASWVCKFGAIFKLNDRGEVLFLQDAMNHFLHGFCVQGIDASHRTIAMICLEQIELEAEFEDWEKVEGEQSAFLNYAKQHWQHHYQIAGKKSLFLKSDRKRRYSELSGRSSIDLMSSSTSDLEPTPSSLQDVQRGFKRLNLEDDWVHVKSGQQNMTTSY